jgi:hypothetical protein
MRATYLTNIIPLNFNTHAIFEPLTACLRKPQIYTVSEILLFTAQYTFVTSVFLRL